MRLQADFGLTRARCVLMRRSPLKLVSGVEHEMNKTVHLSEDKDDGIERIPHLKLLHTLFNSSLQAT